MASASRSRRLPAEPSRIWELIADAHHMPRWWPGVIRVEGVSEEGFTQVFQTKRGRPVRIDYRVVESDPPYRRAWEQEVVGTPFERVLNELIIEVALEAVEDGTEVTISQHQKLRGYSKTGGFMLNRATRRRLDEALDGLALVV